MKHESKKEREDRNKNTIPDAVCASFCPAPGSRDGGQRRKTFSYAEIKIGVFEKKENYRKPMVAFTTAYPGKSRAILWRKVLS
jgi:hypothetical protein